MTSPLASIVRDLAGVRLFAALEPDALESLAARTFTRRLARDQVLFTEGEPSDHVFVVRTGRLRVVASSARGETLVLTTVGPGEALGELSALDGLPRSADVVAAEATMLLVVPAADVLDVLQRNPAALLAVAVELAGGMRRLTGAMADLIFLDLPRRLAKLLVTDSVTGPGGEVRTELGASQSGVAARLGVSRQALNKAMTGFVRRGWIEVHGSQVQLKDVAALQRFIAS